MKIKVEPILFDSYLAMIKNSVGSRSFRNFYAYADESKKDIVKGGSLSCAFFVSSILLFFRLIKEPHLTVAGLVKGMEKSGWREIRKPQIGAVLVWEAVIQNNEPHKHIGFYWKANKAISNSSRLRKPISHHWTFGIKSGKPVRRIERIFWHPKLD
ncbi:MAG: hypothetical protein HYV52_02915 [Parcubacteria group bacterium]|nr:hypothetical protein [Parcubacteria group bacterium]